MRSYSYEKYRASVFTDEGQRMFLRIRDFIHGQLREGGAVRVAEIIRNAGAGDSWTMLACVDRMVELGEIREVTANDDVVGQHRVFVER